MSKKQSRSIGVYAGSFDPITKGHMDIILQAGRLMDTLYVVVAVNPSKKPMFTDDERLEMIQHEIEAVTKPKLGKDGLSCDIKVVKHTGLTAKFMQAHNAPFYIRGLRLGTEFDSEYPAIVAGHKEYKDFAPVFLCATDPDLQIVSSSLVREIARFGGDSIKSYVTPYIARKLKKQIDEGGLRIE